VLFLDEPTLGLDPVQRRRIWGFLRRLCSESGTTLFLTTHYLEEADPCDRVAIIDRGNVIALDTPAALKRTLGRESIEVDGEQLDELAREVERLTGIEPHHGARGLSLVVPDAEQVLSVLLPLTHRGASVRVSEPTLEDVFVALTEREPAEKMS
jgi:ABC-2 type transport system ATP-binding protein